MAETFTKPVEMVMQTCTCGGIFAISKAFEDIAREKGPIKKWWCPYCRGEWSFTTSKATRDATAEKLAAMQRELEQAKKDRDYYVDRACTEMDRSRHKDRQINGYKGILAKNKKALRAGKCPCCGDYLKDLHRHMVKKHPDYEFHPDEPGSGPAVAPAET